MYENVCRTCLRSTSLLPLFPCPKQLMSFERALFLSTGLKIENNDGLPQQICRDCSESVENAMKFRSQSHEAEKKLVNFFKCKPSVNFDDFGEENSQIVKETEFTEIKLNNEQAFLPDVNEDHSSDDDVLYKKLPFKSKCDQKESDSKKKNGNIETYNRKRYLELIEGPLNLKEPIKCKVCKKYSKSFNTFEKHAMSHLGYNILCEFCAKSCISTTSLLRHQRAKHGLARDNSFPCTFCGFQAIDKEQLEVHERKVHTKERPFVCDDCGAGFFSKRVLIQHRVNHKADKPFQCDMCPSKFKLRCHLTNHTNRVHNKSSCKYTYGCHICLKKYSSTGDARKHITKIHGIPSEQQGKVHRFYFQPQD